MSYDSDLNELAEIEHLRSLFPDHHVVFFETPTGFAVHVLETTLPSQLVAYLGIEPGGAHRFRGACGTLATYTDGGDTSARIVDTFTLARLCHRCVTTFPSGKRWLLFEHPIPEED